MQVDNGNIGVAALLIKNDANVAAQCNKGMTPLHIAAGKLSPRLIATLLEEVMIHSSWCKFFALFCPFSSVESLNYASLFLSFFLFLFLFLFLCTNVGKAVGKPALHVATH